MSDVHEQPGQPAPAGGFRFSLRGLMMLVAVCGLVCAFIFRLMYPAIKNAREARARELCLLYLKQIGVAFHTYYDVNGCFPPPFIPDANGKPMHSWRVLIAPYMSDSPFHPQYLYGQPWNGPQNLALAKTPNLRDASFYACPSANQPAGVTNYVMIVGAHQASRIGPLKPLGPPGAANPIIVAEIADSDIFWSEPRDLSIDEISFKINDRSKPSISSHHVRGAMVLLADGSVEFLDESTDPDELNAMLTGSGSEGAGPP